MIIREQCCCDEMWKSVLFRDKIPISIERCGAKGREFYRFTLEFVDDYNPEEDLLYGENPGDGLIFCPFCGKQILPCDVDLSREWKKHKCICEDFLEWFMKGIHYPNMKAPTPMFKYEPKENQFYMHCRKGFGEGWIPVKYCIYCGEPLSEMVEKFGIPKVILDRINPFE